MSQAEHEAIVKQRARELLAALQALQEDRRQELSQLEPASAEEEVQARIAELRLAIERTDDLIQQIRADLLNDEQLNL
jgi:hypothetical protein